ncbi:1 [Hexamita inflata]|uniref:alpha-amylase n=1 Tax=Hexamita inflata TaxID=28002 RepID=A0AA86Q8B7_9EUKA|nr:1 [Hexamita inflata] [Hexamita inflata]CAI9950913.1 1 [Hexamita inflata] [Hexamita inflata]
MIGLVMSFAFPELKEFRKRRIYQIMTDRFAGMNQSSCIDLNSYCGGDFKGIRSKLDYIQNLGYNAIWISPTVEQVSNSISAYHGYWFSNFYGTNPHFGSEQDLKDLINEAHKRDIFVIADVVYNHVGSCPGGSQDFSCVVTFPLPEYYHPDCYIYDWNNDTLVQNCRLYGLPDLDQDHPFVRQQLLNWAQWYQQQFNFDGFRIDTVKHIDHKFWKDLRKVTPWFNIGEIYDGSYTYLRQFTNQEEVHSTFNYPLFFAISNAIGNSQSMYQLSNTFSESVLVFEDDVYDLGVFFENHDNPRFLAAHNDIKKYENALALIHTWVGIPVLYYGQEQDLVGGFDSENRQALWLFGYDQNANHYQFIKQLNDIRCKIPFDQLDQKELYVSDNFYSYSRGNRVMVALTNAGKGSSQIFYNVENSPFSANTKICDIFSKECINVNIDGSVDIYLNQGQTKVYIMESDMI